VQRLEEAGAAAVVLYSLFEEQITHESRALDHYLTHGTESYAEALSYFPDLDRYNLEPDCYLEHVQRVKRAVDIPVIGSLNGISPGGWVEYAHKIEQAGADALELNLYYLPADWLYLGRRVQRHDMSRAVCRRRRDDHVRRATLDCDRRGRAGRAQRLHRTAAAAVGVRCTANGLNGLLRR
jgi:dihydroorotate dehydrogenase (fumarate)